MMPTVKPIVVVGSINTDLVVRSERLPVAGETIAGRSFATFQGGKGANQAVAAALLGARVLMVGKVGSDAFGAESIRQLERHGVDCEHVQKEPGDSGVALITVAEGGRNTIVVVPGANALVSAAFVESKRQIVREAGIVLAQLEIPLDAVIRLAQICAEEGVPLMLDPSPARALPAALFGRCEWLTPNETEALFYADEADPTMQPERIVEALRAKGARNLLLKRSERGVYVDHTSLPAVSIPAVQVAAVDTTGAGDTCNGAFAVGLVAGRNVMDCARFASAAAALSVTRNGAQASMPTLAEVEASVLRIVVS